MNRKKILVVDDEPSITSLLKLNLEKSGAYTVRVENEGAQALPAARQFKPDLDGGDAAAQIRADPLLRDVPIVFLTAAVKKEELKGPEGMIGGFPYIAKPLNVKGVMSVIEKHLGK